jgi:hypothetical protein
MYPSVNLLGSGGKDQFFWDSIPTGNLQRNDRRQSDQAVIHEVQARQQSNFPWRSGSGGETGSLKED